MRREMAGRDVGRPALRPPAGGWQRALVVTDDADLLEAVLSIAAAIGIARKLPWTWSAPGPGGCRPPLCC